MSKAIEISAAELLTLATISVWAQTKVLQGEMKTVTATVEAIETASRQVTARKPDGTDVTFYVPTSMKRFDSLKVGDKLTAKYYDNIVLQVKEAGTPDVDAAAGKLVPVNLQAAVTEVGTLELRCLEKGGPGRWKLEMNLRTKE